MTRVNLLPTKILADQHMFAELREIKMVPLALQRSLRTQSITTVKKKIPSQFTLNSGHVLFFYDKMKFLQTRYIELHNEAISRGYKLDKESERRVDMFEFSSDWMGNYIPDSRSLKISATRIVERISQKPTWYRIRGIPLDNNWKNAYDSFL